MKKIIAGLIIAFCMGSASYAQDYSTGIGVRGGFANGLTIKHFVSQNTAFEFLFASRWRGIEFTGLYEIHHTAFHEERLNFYYGIGGHVGFWNGDYTYKYWGTAGSNYTVIGIDGILGIEYNFTELPFNIGLDWKPAFNIVGYTGFWGDGGALSVRYIF
jgi:hypothetical protein